MKKSRLIFLVSGTFLLGIIIGAVVAGFLCVHFMNRFASLAAGSAATMDVATLQRIRTGDTNRAIELVEINLDGDIVMLGSYLGDVSPSRRDPALVGVLQQARDYRTKHPRKANSPEEEILMTRAFDLVGEQKSH